MSIFKRILAIFLAVLMLVPAVPLNVFAAVQTDRGIEASDNGGVYKIANDYVRFVYNSNTGGFSFETKEGHPQKRFDNNIPLLYAEDADRSNGTSYTTVRIDGKDYIFGQDYSWFGIETQTFAPVISNGGRVMTVSWGVNGYIITQTAIISEVEDSDLAGNIGIGYTVVNTNETAGFVGVRLLLDNALDSKVDAPYVLSEAMFSPAIVETEFSDALGNMPNQLTYVDSIANTKKMGYALLKGWSGEDDTTPDKVIVGHWANLANTRYEYVPDPGCDFSNYSNAHRVPDTATAIYWNEAPVLAKSSRTMEMLYGIGNFTKEFDADTHLGISVNVPSVKLNETKDGYENGGEIELDITIDNTVDNAYDLATLRLDVVLDDGVVFKDGGKSTTTYELGQVLGEQILSYALKKGEVKNFKETLVVSPEANITSKNIIVSVSTTEVISESQWEQANYSSSKNILVPGVDSLLPDVKMTTVTPDTVYIEGEKNLTVSGDMTALKSLRATSGWELFLVKGDHEVHINKSDIAFTDEKYKTMTFSTDQDLEVGEYQIEFRFTDVLLKAELTDKIIASQKVIVSSDEYYRSQSYGLVAMIRFPDEAGRPVYDFFTFISEKQLIDFKNGDFPLNGLRHTAVTFDDDCEVMAAVRGKIRRMQDEDGSIFYQANTEDGDVTINNLLIYKGKEPLFMKFDGEWASAQENIASISGRGTIKVINSINVWHEGWSIDCADGKFLTLNDPDDGQELVLGLGVGGAFMQFIGGLLIELKYGQLTEDDGLYGISFGGKVEIPLKAKEKEKAKDSSSSGSGSTGSGSSGSGSTGSGSTGSGSTGSGSSGSGSSGSGSSGSGSSGSGSSGSGSSGSGSSGSGSSGSGSSGSGSSGSGSTGSTNKKPAGLVKPSGDTPPRLEITTSDSKVGEYIRGLGEVEDEPDEGAIVGEISDVIFGHKSYNEETGEFETGFVGIDCSLEVNLPADILGGPLKNKWGVMAKVSINTIDKAFGIDFGIEVKDILECNVELAFKQIQRKGVEKYYPDVIKLYLGGNFMRIPFFGIPGVFVSGIGGGVSNLADTLKDKSPGEDVAPLTFHVRLDLIFVELLKGKFEGEFCAEYVQITGEMVLNNDDDGKILKVEAGVNARWKPSVNINIYGNASLLDGFLKGSINIRIEPDYFHIYICGAMCIPDSIPIVGGMELSGFELGGGTDFIGANIKIIGIKFGVIYYWGSRELYFGQGNDLSGRGAAVTSLDSSYYDEDGQYVMCTGLYGTNLRRLDSKKIDSGRAGTIVIQKEFDPANQDAILFEVPINGVILPKADEIILVSPSGKQIEMIESDGIGGGNFLINDRGENEQKYLYITITDKELLEKGIWNLSVTTNGVEISDFEVNGVDNLPELTEISYTYDETNPYAISVDYILDGENDVPGTLDVYITENANALNDLRQSVANPDTGLIPVGKVTLTEMKNGNVTFDIPDTLNDGEFYVIAMLTQDIGGLSMVMSDTPFTFKNNKLPSNVDAVNVTYGGDGDLRIEIERENEVDFDTYVIRILDENGEIFNDAIFEEAVNDKIFNEELGEYENEVYYYGEHQGLIPGQTYTVAIDTVRYEDDKRYYSNETVYSEPYIMREKQTPVLLSIETNIDPDADVLAVDTFEATYTFDRDVYLFLMVDNLRKSYSTECKKVHTVSVPLIEGDHFIDFYAVTPEFDTTDSTIHEEAGFGFRVDTTPPTLKIGQSTSEAVSIESDELVAVSQQNVVIDENGMIKFSGVTESDAVLTLDGTTDGITKSLDGSFTVERQADPSKDMIELKAVDKAGNSTSLPIHVIDPSVVAFKGISLVCDTEMEDADDVKKITIPVGTRINLGVLGITPEKNVQLNSTDVSWSVLYEKNVIGFTEGEITALVPGETAVSALYKVASFEVDGKVQTKTLSDTVIIEVVERRIDVIDGDDGAQGSVSVDYTRIDYADYSRITIYVEGLSEASVTATVDGKPVVFYLDGENTYVASVDTDVDMESVLGALTVDKNGEQTELLKGDYDGNGVVNEYDRDLSIDTSIGKSNNTLDVDSYIRGDVNGDGVINIVDAQLILRTSLGK